MAFLVCLIARVFSAGFPKKGSKTPLFATYTGTCTARHAASMELQPASPKNKGCARMFPFGPRTGHAPFPPPASPTGPEHKTQQALFSFTRLRAFPPPVSRKAPQKHPFFTPPVGGGL